MLLLQNYRNMRYAQRLQAIYYIESNKIKFHPLWMVSEGFMKGLACKPFSHSVLKTNKISLRMNR